MFNIAWGKKTVKIAISIGQNANNAILEQFTGNQELVIQANNVTALVKMIKWASTAVSSVSAPASRISDGEKTSDQKNTLMLDMNNIPDPDDISDEEVW